MLVTGRSKRKRLTQGVGSVLADGDHSPLPWAIIMSLLRSFSLARCARIKTDRFASRAVVTFEPFAQLRRIFPEVYGLNAPACPGGAISKFTVQASVPAFL